MSPELSFSGLSVLVARIAPHSVATVHALLRDGARVTVAAALDDLPTSLRDLAERGLVTLVPPAGRTAYHGGPDGAALRPPRGPVDAAPAAPRSRCRRRGAGGRDGDAPRRRPRRPRPAD